MLSRTDLRGHVPSPAALRATLPRAEVDVDAVLHQVRPIVDAVRERGVPAVLEFTERFDKIRPAPCACRTAAWPRRWTSSTRRCGRAEEAIARVRRVHADQRRTDVTTRWCRAAPSPSGGCRCAGSACTRRAASRCTRPAW